MSRGPDVGSSDRFRLGVNYWPRRKAMYWWNDFDASEVADEFDVIVDIGMDVVRIFLLWDHWQPTPDSVPPARITDLGLVCDLAAERGLGLDVTFFTGHMSGPNWAPGWLLDATSPHPSPHVRQVLSGDVVVDCSYRNMFTDPVALGAARLLLSEVVGALGDHEAIWMWNLGNEPDLFAQPPSAVIGRRWVADMVDTIRQIDDTHPVTCGLHAQSLFADNGLRVHDVFAETHIAVMHGYPMYVDWAEGPLDPDFVPYLCALTSALSGKPALAEEWGGCTAPDGGASTTWDWDSYGGLRRTQFMAGEEAFAAYVGQVLPRLHAGGSPGALLWCFADYAEHLWDRPPCDPNGATHERHFGLVRPDGSLKPHADVVRRFAASSPQVRRDAPAFAVDVTPEEFYGDPSAHARRLYGVYRDRVARIGE